MRTLVELSRDSVYSLIFHLAPRFANTFLFIFIGRLSGPTEAGIFSLAITYLVISTTVTRGLDDLVVRQVSREPDQAGHYLTTFLMLRIVLSSLLYGALVLVVRRPWFGYSDRTSTTILILALSLVPDSLMYVAQSIFLGLRRFSTPAIALAGINLSKLVTGALALNLGCDVQRVAWLWPIGSSLGAIVLVVDAFRCVGGVQWSDWTDWHPLARHWRTGLSFLFITTLGMLETQVDTIILSRFHGETEVGWYGAATTVTYGLVMFSQAYRFAVYPVMTRYALRSSDKLSELYKDSVRYLGTLILPVVAGIALLSPDIVYLLFGPEFQPTIATLRILILTLVFMFLNEPNVRMLLVQDRQNWVSLFLVGSVATNVALNLALDPSQGALGAAVSRVSSALVFFLLNLLYVTRSFVEPENLRPLFKPVLATSVMGMIVWALDGSSMLVSVVLGALAYGAALCLVGGISLQEMAALYRFLTQRRSQPASTGENGLNIREEAEP